MKPHTRRGHWGMRRQASFTPFFFQRGQWRTLCSRFSTFSPHRTQVSPTWKAEWARSSCHTPPRPALRAAFLSFF
eukprot:4343444-Amphidinium_carterae.1